MPESTIPTWKMPLHEPPVIVFMGIGGLIAGKKLSFEVPQGQWALHLYNYDSRFWINDSALSFRAGTAGITAPGHNTTYLSEKPTTHFYCLMKLKSSHAPITIPSLHFIQNSFAPLFERAREAVGFLSRSRRKAEARVWDILWEISELTSSSHSKQVIHPAINLILTRIEQFMNEPLTISSLVKEAGLSHNHFTRLFKQEMGCTPERYLCIRRTNRARHLLQNTSWPIKSIATDVGIPDLHLFNKVIRRELGQSPRELRG